MGVLIDKEQEAYRQGLKRVEKAQLQNASVFLSFSLFFFDSLRFH